MTYDDFMKLDEDEPIDNTEYEKIMMKKKLDDFVKSLYNED